MICEAKDIEEREERGWGGEQEEDMREGKREAGVGNRRKMWEGKTEAGGGEQKKDVRESERQAGVGSRRWI